MRRTTTSLVCDVTGQTAERTVRFSVDGTHYELDLANETLALFYEEVGKWSDLARKVKAPTARRKRANNDTGALREWARANGYGVSDRGTVAKEVRIAYEAWRSLGKPEIASTIHIVDEDGRVHPYGWERSDGTG